jgi:hypothetical protein
MLDNYTIAQEFGCRHLVESKTALVLNSDAPGAPSGVSCFCRLNACGRREFGDLTGPVAIPSPNSRHRCKHSTIPFLTSWISSRRSQVTIGQN